jgi:hypothetical protein
VGRDDDVLFQKKMYWVASSDPGALFSPQAQINPTPRRRARSDYIFLLFRREQDSRRRRRFGRRSVGS